MRPGPLIASHPRTNSMKDNLIEHLNAEIALNTVTDIPIALEWLKSTFFYVRVQRSPETYGSTRTLTPQRVQQAVAGAAAAAR